MSDVRSLAVDWKPWLTRWSREWIASAEPRELEPDTVRDGWLGYAPAAPDAVAAAEARLGVRLPPSYRDFLLTTDGWRHAGMFVPRMRGTSSLSWLNDVDPDWAENWDEFYAPEDDDDDDYSGEGPQSGNPFRRALLISLVADSGILVLNPEDVNDAGEWAAYSHFTWRAQPPVRFDSFTALMEHLYAEFHQMRHPAGETRDAWDDKIEQARIDALAGQIEGPAAALAQAEEFGRSRAGLLRAQLLLFLGQQDDAYRLLGDLLHPQSRPEGMLTDPLFTEELLPLLFIEHDRTAGPAHASVLQAALIGNRPEVRELEIVIAEHQARLRRPGDRLSYGNRDFDSLIRAALSRHRDEPDALWQAVMSALPLWRPRSAGHVAPVVLLAEAAMATAITPARGRELLSQRRGGPAPGDGEGR